MWQIDYSNQRYIYVYIARALARERSSTPAAVPSNHVIVSWLLADLNYEFCLLRDLIDIIVCELSPVCSYNVAIPTVSFRLEFIKTAKQLFSLLAINTRERRKWFSWQERTASGNYTYDGASNYMLNRYVFLRAAVINAASVYFYITVNLCRFLNLPVQVLYFYLV